MIYMLLANGFEEVEAIAPLDLLRRAEFEVKTVSTEATLAVTGAHGVTVTADIMPEEATEKISLLILPGGMPGTTNLDASAFTDVMIKRTVEDGGHLAAICAAPLILGKRGLLSGRHATCYPGFVEDLKDAILFNDSVVTDCKITTANGMQSALEFGNELVKVMKTGYGSYTFETGEELILRALSCIISQGRVSPPILQRCLNIGYSKAARIVDILEERGYISAFDGKNPRKILITEEEYRAFRDSCRKEAGAPLSQDEETGEEDRLLSVALNVALECGKVTTSLLQRHLSIGYGRAARLIDRLTELGFISAPNGQHPRTVLINEQQYSAFLKKCEDDKKE